MKEFSAKSVGHEYELNVEQKEESASINKLINKKSILNSRSNPHDAETEILKARGTLIAI